MSAQLIIDIPGDNFNLHKLNMINFVENLENEQDQLGLRGFRATLIEGELDIQVNPTRQEVYRLR